MSRDLKADLKHISENPSITKLMELTEEAIERAIKAEAELPALQEENDIQRASIQELSRQLAECQRALSLACKELPAIPDEIGRLEDIFLYQAAQAKAGDK